MDKIEKLKRKINIINYKLRNQKQFKTNEVIILLNKIQVFSIEISILRKDNKTNNE